MGGKLKSVTTNIFKRYKLRSSKTELFFKIDEYIQTKS